MSSLWHSSPDGIHAWQGTFDRDWAFNNHHPPQQIFHCGGSMRASVVQYLPLSHTSSLWHTPDKNQLPGVPGRYKGRERERAPVTSPRKLPVTACSCLQPQWQQQQQPPKWLHEPAGRRQMTLSCLYKDTMAKELSAVDKRPAQIRSI